MVGLLSNKKTKNTDLQVRLVIPMVVKAAKHANEGDCPLQRPTPNVLSLSSQAQAAGH